MDAERILSLDFDHDVFRAWTTGPWTNADYVVCDERRLAAAITRLDRLERTPKELTREQRDALACMVHGCSERVRGKTQKKHSDMFRPGSMKRLREEKEGRSATAERRSIDRCPGTN